MKDIILFIYIYINYELICNTRTRQLTLDKKPRGDEY